MPPREFCASVAAGKTRPENRTEGTRLQDTPAVIECQFRDLLWHARTFASVH